MKRLLKKIFPVAFLKKCFLLYNTFKINTVDKVLYSAYTLDESEVVKEKHANPFDQITIRKMHMLPVIAHKFDFWKNWHQDEYLIKVRKPITIEPNYGWGIHKQNHLVYSSLGFSRVSYLPKPNLINYWVSKKEPYKKVISLRDTGELNYFHFYNDVIAKLFYLEDHEMLNDTVSVVVAKELFEKKYFQFFIKRLGYENLHWVLQDKQYIKADEAIFCKPLTHTKRYYDKFRQAVVNDIHKEKQNRKIFLTRNPKRLRHIANMHEVSEVCLQYGFEVIDAEDYSIEEQIALFASTKYLIGIHGAGLMNLLFCHHSTSVLSIFAPGPYLQFHYILLANMYEIHFDAIVGEKTKGIFKGEFKVIPDLLENRIIKLLQ